MAEVKHDDFYQISQDIVSMKEVISLETTAIPSLSDATSLTLGTEETIITHGTLAPTMTMSTLSSLETSTTDAITTFSSLKKTEFESSEELESTEEEFPSASTTIPSEISEQPTQRVDILTTKVSETWLPTESSTTFSTISKEVDEPGPSVSQESELNPFSATLAPPTLSAILVPTARPTSPRRRLQSVDRPTPNSHDEPPALSTIKKFFHGIGCAVKECELFSQHQRRPKVEITNSTNPRFARDHGSVHTTDNSCSCGTKKQNSEDENTSTSSSANTTDIQNVHS